MTGYRSRWIVLKGAPLNEIQIPKIPIFKEAWIAKNKDPIGDCRSAFGSSSDESGFSPGFWVQSVA